MRPRGPDIQSCSSTLRVLRTIAMRGPTHRETRERIAWRCNLMNSAGRDNTYRSSLALLLQPPVLRDSGKDARAPRRTAAVAAPAPWSLFVGEPGRSIFGILLRPLWTSPAEQFD